MGLTETSRGICNALGLASCDAWVVSAFTVWKKPVYLILRSQGYSDLRLDQSGY
jgi:hypothetical protein